MLFLFDIVRHKSGFEHIERRHYEPRDGPCDRTAAGKTQPTQLNVCLTLALSFAFKLDLKELEKLIKGKLDGTEGNLTHDQTAVPSVEALDALVLVNL